MKKEDILRAAGGNGSTLAYPVEFRKAKCGSKEQAERWAVKLFIRDDVNSFKSQERWSYAYINNRIYFFYGEQVNSYKVQESTGSHFIQFTNDELFNALFGKGEKVRKMTWSRDDESGLHYVQL